MKTCGLFLFATVAIAAEPATKEQADWILWNQSQLADRLAAQDAAKEKREQDENVRRFWAAREKAVEAASLTYATPVATTIEAPIAPQRESLAPAILPATGQIRIFPLRPDDFQTVAAEPMGLKPAQRAAMTAESTARAILRHPYLGISGHPRRKQFEAFVASTRTLPDYAVLYSLACWPELAAMECARVSGW